MVDKVEELVSKNEELQARIKLLERSMCSRNEDTIDEVVMLSKTPADLTTKPNSLPLGNMFTYTPGSILVTRCNSGGGLYLINFSERSNKQEKVFDGDCRGIARYNDYYVIASIPMAFCY